LIDFTSNETLGRVLENPTPERQRLWRGLSVYDSESRARRKALGIPTIGRSIARLDIPTDGTIAFERTTNSSGHYTVWGTPEQFMACWVPPAVPVRKDE
jgi:hypothetical protein